MFKRIGLFLSLACCIGGALFAEEESAIVTLAQAKTTFDIDTIEPRALLAHARTMFPREAFTIEGELSVELTRGRTESARPYTLALDWAANEPRAFCTFYYDEEKRQPLFSAELTRRAGKPVLSITNTDGVTTEHTNLNMPVGESDLSWVDLAFEYLWWDDVRKLSEEECSLREISSRQIGRNCVVLEVKPPVPISGLGSMLLWMDRATGFVIQSQHLAEDGHSVRRIWVQRLGRENGRWVPRLFSVQRANIRRKTHLRIYTITSDTFSVERTEEE